MYPIYAQVAISKAVILRLGEGKSHRITVKTAKNERQIHNDHF